jgi:hypothetical protein
MVKQTILRHQGCRSALGVSLFWSFGRYAGVKAVGGAVPLLQLEVVAVVLVLV